MASLRFIRWCGLAAIVGGVVYVSLDVLGVLYIYLYSPSSDEDIPPALNYIEGIFLFLLLLGALAAIAGLHALQRRRYGWAGVLASLVAFLGVALILVGVVTETLAGPAFEPSLVFLIPGSLVATVGLVALGAVTMAARVLPWWCGASIIAGSPPVAILFGTLVGVAWVLVGYALLRRAEISSEHPPQVR
jgi:hypothetical protein